MYTIVKVRKSFNMIKDIPLKSYDTKEKALGVLNKLARIKHWNFIKGILFDRYSDQDSNFYYIKTN